MATIESGNSTQRPTNENTENKKYNQTNKYRNLYNSEIKEEDEYNNSNRSSFDKNSKNCSRREIPFTQDINQKFTFNNKVLNSMKTIN